MIISKRAWLVIGWLLLVLKGSAAETDWEMVPAILQRIVPPVFPAKDFKVTDYGAVAGTNDSCRAFKDAIAACSKAGGGRVLVPAGTYTLNGPIHLLSNV